jgi:hypothetical protein
MPHPARHTHANAHPHSPAPLSQLSRQPTLRTLLQTAQGAETCTARPHVHMQRIIDTGPCFPLASAPPAGCNPQTSPTAKSARPARSVARHDPTTKPQRGSQLNRLILRFRQPPTEEIGLSRLPPPNSHLQPGKRKVGGRPGRRNPAAALPC